MRLPLFFPTSIIIIGAMVWYAIEPGFDSLEEMERIKSSIFEHGYIVEGDALSQGREGVRSNMEVYGPPSLRRAVMSSHGGPDEGTPSHGILFVAPPFTLQAFAGRTIEVMLSARSANENGAERALLRLDIQNFGGSGWREIELSDEFSEVGFSYQVPDVDTRDPVLMLVWPDADGEGGQIEVRQVILRPVD